MVIHRVVIQSPYPQPPSHKGRGTSNSLFRKTPSPLVGEGWGGGVNGCFIASAKRPLSAAPARCEIPWWSH